MKSLNSETRTQVIHIDTLLYNLETALPVWEKTKTMGSNKEMMKCFKTAKTYIRKGMESLFSELDDREVAALQRRKDISDIVLMPKGDFKRLQAQHEDRYTISKALAVELSEGIIEGFCRGCDRKACDCYVRTQLMSWDIPPANEEYEECQYRYEKE